VAKWFWLGGTSATLAVGIAATALAVTGASTITTYAGTGVLGFSGDGGSATAARLNYPRAIAVDGQGNLYIADTYNYRIRKVTKGRTITTFAGTGAPGFSGDGGPATRARIGEARGVAVDGAGNVYISDTENNRVRKVTTDGTIRTIAGTGREVASGDGGPATAASIGRPEGLAIDRQGNVYVVDFADDRVRRIDSNGTITTFAGTGEAGFSGDGGPATKAKFGNVGGVAVDSTGNVYISDETNFRIRKVSPAGTITTFAGTGQLGFGGDGRQARTAILNLPDGLAVSAQGDLYIADYGNTRVRKVSRAGIITTIAGGDRFGYSGDGGHARGALLNRALSVAVDTQGDLYIADWYNHRVRKVSTAAPTTGTSGPCSRATAIKLAKQLHLGPADFTPKPVAQVMCGPFAGRGSKAMTAVLTGGGASAAVGGWAVFRLDAGGWKLLLFRKDGAEITRAGSNIRERVFIARPTDPHCCPSGGSRSRIWHWNGTRLVASRWKFEPPKPKP
jgi:sugar lactone lactonase YvrE